LLGMRKAGRAPRSGRPAPPRAAPGCPLYQTPLQLRRVRGHSSADSQGSAGSGEDGRPGRSPLFLRYGCFLYQSRRPRVLSRLLPDIGPPRRPGATPRNCLPKRASFPTTPPPMMGGDSPRPPSSSVLTGARTAPHKPTIHLPPSPSVRALSSTRTAGTASRHSPDLRTNSPLGSGRCGNRPCPSHSASPGRRRSPSELSRPRMV